MLLTVLLISAASLGAATPSDFYLSLLQRGIVSYNAEKYPEASRQLKIAAFGFVDSLEHYQTAQVYLALVYDRLGDQARALDAARRVMNAERITPTFARIQLPVAVSSAFESLISRTLSASEAAALRRGAQTPATPPSRTTPAQPERTTQPASSEPAPRTPVSQQSSAPTEPADPPPPAAPPATEPQKTPVPAPPATATTTTTTTTHPKPPVQQPARKSTAPLTQQEIADRLAEADRALNGGLLAEARVIYRDLLHSPSVSRATLVRVAEGLYRTRDFAGALEAFKQIGTLRKGEEPYHYYIAVSLYETGQYEQAKAELESALPFIEVTPDVARYRTKINSTPN